MVPACQTKKGADARCGETVQQRQTSHQPCQLVCYHFHTDLQVVEGCLVIVSSCWSGEGQFERCCGRRSIDENVCLFVAHVWYIHLVGSFETFPTIQYPPAERGWMDAHIHSAYAKFVHPRSSQREERLLLAHLEHAVAILQRAKRATGSREH